MCKYNFVLMIEVYCMQSSCLLTMVRKHKIKANVIKHWEAVNALQTVIAEATTRFTLSICDALMNSEFAYQ